MRRAILAAAVLAALPGALAAQSTITKSTEAGVTVYRGSVARSATPEIAPEASPVKTEPETFTGSAGTERRHLPGGSFTYTRTLAVPILILKGGVRYSHTGRTRRSGIRRQP